MGYPIHVVISRGSNDDTPFEVAIENLKVLK